MKPALPLKASCRAVVLLAAFYFMSPIDALAAISGPCSGCHTMHNSQNNTPMRFNTGATTNPEPLAQLLKDDCYGCHAQGGSNALVTIGVDVTPQVYHFDGNGDLAGGNFAYVTSDFTKGHNISDLTGTDGMLHAPPGGIVQSFHDDGTLINTNKLRCAGTGGCHGNRAADSSLGVEGITGAHHNNVNGAVTQAAGNLEPGHGYRFLVGVNGYEDSNWQYAPTATSAQHNEYYGRTAPTQLGCSGAAISCHGYGGVRPPNGTMAEYCSTCHGNFHTLSTTTSDGIGSTASSPFIRHPSDLTMPIGGEFDAYTEYKTNTPVARTTVPGSSSSIVASGVDSVFCLSCHVAHGSPYPDMLRWDYSTMQVGNAGAAAGTGCFACHTAKG